MNIWWFLLSLIAVWIGADLITNQLQSWFLDWPLIWLHLPALTIVVIVWLFFVTKFSRRKTGISSSKRAFLYSLLALNFAIYYRPDTVGEFLLIAMLVSAIILSGAATRRYYGSVAEDGRDSALLED